MQTVIPHIDNDQLADAIRRGATIVDVREPEEYVAGHVPGAALIPQGELPHRAGEIDRSRPVYIVCQSGNRSDRMTGFLRGAGYDAYSVAGGTAGWAGAGGVLVGGQAPRN